MMVKQRHTLVAVALFPMLAVGCLPTPEPAGLPDIQATVEAGVKATIAAAPTPTAIPTATPTPKATPTPDWVIQRIKRDHMTFYSDIGSRLARCVQEVTAI